MIIIVAPFPNPQIPRDGFSARINYIDNIFSEEEKIYLWPDSKLRTIKPLYGSINEKAKEAYINPWNPIHIAWTIRLSTKAKFCYFHSVYQTLKLFYLLIIKKCIVDLHGIAPEELKMIGRTFESILIGIAERYSVNKAYKVIAVTNAMADYIRKKYKNSKISFIILPIFGTKYNKKSIKEIRDLSQREKLPIIYSGTASIWQAVDKITSLIHKTQSDYSYTILTPDKEIFSKKLDSKKVSILSVSQNDVFNYYSKNLFGIVIREKNPVNTVSCPTKLIEYMANSLVPIVEYSNIGDFKDLGYKYISSKEIESHKIPTYKRLYKIITTNHKILKNYERITEEGIKELKKQLF